MPRRITINARGIGRQPIPGSPPDHMQDSAFSRVAIGLNNLTDCVNSIPNYPVGTPNYVTTSYTFKSTDVSVFAQVSGITITMLPAKSNAAGYSVYIYNNSSGNITVAGSGSDTVDGSSTETLPTATGAWYAGDGVSNWSKTSVSSASGALVSPLTTKGDLWGFSTVNARVPLSGSNGYVLTENSTLGLGLGWASLPPFFTMGVTIWNNPSTNITPNPGCNIMTGTAGAFSFQLPLAASNPNTMYLLNMRAPVNTTVPIIASGSDTFESQNGRGNCLYASDGVSKWYNVLSINLP